MWRIISRDKYTGIVYRVWEGSKGSKNIQARIPIKVKRPEGEIRSERIDRATKTDCIVTARKYAKSIQKKKNKDAYKEEKPKKKKIGFAEAGLTYTRTKSPGRSDRRYIHQLTLHFKDKPLNEIDQKAMLDFCEKTYPDGTPQTLNRQAFTPMIAIMTLAKAHHELTRPKGHDFLPDIELPDEDWLPSVLNVAPAEICALLLALSFHGRRLTEYLSRKPSDYDSKDGTLYLGKTKNGQKIQILLSDPVCEALDMITRNKRQEGWLFCRGPNSKSRIYEAIKKACRKARVKYHTPHPAGRHTFATRLLKAGKSIKYVQEAGGWGSYHTVARRYGHLEKTEIAKDIREMGNEMGKELARKQKPAAVIDLLSKIKAKKKWLIPW